MTKGMKLFGIIENFCKENASTMSMAGGILCILGSLYCAYKAADDVAEINKDYADKKEEIESRPISDDEKAKLIKELKSHRNIRVIIAGRKVLIFSGGAIVLVILTELFNGMAIAGLTALVVSKEDRIKALLKNGKEMIGEDKMKDIEDKSIEDLISEKFFGESTARRVSPRNGHLILDADSSTLFQIHEDELKQVLEYAEDYCKRNHGLSQEKFFEMLGFVEAPTNAKVKWWGPKRPFKAHVGNRAYLGAQIPSIEYEYLPGPASEAGIPSIGLV